MPLHLSPSDVANSVRLFRQQFDGAILILEGTTDSTLFRRLVDRDRCRLIAATCKSSAIGAIEILEKAGVQKVLCVVDADFDRVLKREYESPNIIPTDYHDIEMHFVHSDCFDKVLYEYGQESKSSSSADIRKHLLDQCRPYSTLKLQSTSELLNLTFSSVNFKDCLDLRAMILDPECLSQQVLNKSNLHGPHRTEAVSQLQAVQLPEADDLQLFSGKDLIELLRLGLCRCWGTLGGRSVPESEFIRAFRLAYDVSDLLESQMFARIRAWQDLNGLQFIRG